ncbi:hypothetical protein [Pseudodesulfovibrio sp.]|uniref:hypothetical protein n=1 Tax=unclassified Pseudodesulfovibrio TaxID=2661612 RepID=UPI003B00E82D
MAKFLYGILLLLALAGCARSHVVSDMAEDTDWMRMDAEAPLPAVGWVRGQAKTVHIYIEGDGVAYSTRTSPSPDPTPITPTALLLARQDNAPAVAYLGRPCQYVTGDACTTTCWTTGRFSENVVKTENQLVDRAKRATGAQQVVLIGFSGGGAVAALLAEARDDVAELITVCGNLDHTVWTRMHNVTPLYGSLNPADKAARLASLRQIHLLGEEDTNVTRRVTDSFVAKLPKGASVLIRTIPGLAHGGEAWAEVWPGILAGIVHLPE